MEYKYETTYESGEAIDSYNAAFNVAFADGISDKDQIKAWSYLIGSGEADRVGGWYKSKCDNLVNIGLISKEGVIDWTKYEEFLSKPKVTHMKVDTKVTKQKVVKEQPKKFEPTIKIKSNGSKGNII